MRLAWATDIHLNFLSRKELGDFFEQIRATRADALIVTGDIAEAPSVQRLLLTMAEAIARPVYFVLGNHDFYHGSIAEVRRAMAALGERSPHLRWLTGAGVVELTPGVALVGHEGWADGRIGDYARSPVLLNDYFCIEDLAGRDRDTRLVELHRLGDEAARELRVPLSAALDRYPRVFVATHAPPFREACWHEGQISNDDWLPHFTCKAIGDLLLSAAGSRPDRSIEVLCGHTHSEGVARMAPNLRVRTGRAEYGCPSVHDVIEIG